MHRLMVLGRLLKKRPIPSEIYWSLSATQICIFLKFGGWFRGVDVQSLFAAKSSIVVWGTGVYRHIDPDTAERQKMAKADRCYHVRNIQEHTGNFRHYPCAVTFIVGNQSDEDIRHALYAHKHVNADVKILGGADHNPAQQLKKAGILEKILEEFVSTGRISDYRSLSIGERATRLISL